jgi:hypothetical protein
MPDNLDYCWQRCGLLFAAACCRSVWHLLPDGPSRIAVVTAEAHADGLQGRSELLEAEQKAYEAAERLLEQTPDLEWKRSPTWHAMWAAASLTGATSGRRPISGASHHTQYAIAWERAPRPNQREEREAIRQFEGQRQWRWVVDIFGNPFRRSNLNPVWLAWKDRNVPKLAQSIYVERAFERLPVLADALEEAGCEDANILTHCRSDGQHIRGCWVLDLLLGKE